MKKHKLILKALVMSAFFCINVQAQTDTLRVMAYNVLYYGETPSCQGPHDKLHGYLKTIIEYTRPDIVGLTKFAAPAQQGNPFATAPIGFPDSILRYALNAAMPGKYAYCPYSNAAMANNIELLCYDQHKLGFVSVVSSYANITDINTYKLYYKDPNLNRTHDTTFLYVTLNHIKSGDESVAVREAQMKGEMNNIKKHFTTLPNHINMGDFNVRSSNEPFYQALCFPDDSNFRFYDPPFYDGNLKYPANWDHDANYAKYFTTSTRQTKEFPNKCGTGGGAKNWYDHIFFSSWIAKNTNYVRYIPNSYRTVGNNGVRYKISINDKNPANTSAPAEVIEALYQFSNKYPVMLDLEVTPNTSGISPKDPEVGAPVAAQETITIDGPANDEITAHFPAGFNDQAMTVAYIDATGKEVNKKSFNVKKQEMRFPFSEPVGTYTVRFCTVHSVAAEIKVVKK